MIPSSNDKNLTRNTKKVSSNNGFEDISKKHNLENNNLKDRMGYEEISQNIPAKASNLDKHYGEENNTNNIGDKKNLEEDEDSTEDADDTTTDDEPNFRDKDKEIKENIKNTLSLDVQDVINLNDDELNDIIEQLKKKGVSSDKGLQLQHLRNINRGSRTHGK